MRDFSVAISWYPGHMHKARKELGALLRGAGLAMEVLDARIPGASSNPLLRHMRAELPVVRILNKCDLADPETTNAWLSHYAADGGNACLASGRDTPLDSTRLNGHIRRLAENARGGVQVIARRGNSDFSGSPAVSGKIAIIGIPNVGKSSLLNLLAGRKLARTGNTPAITRRQQTAAYHPDWTLVDTPGMLRPRLEDQRAALLMASVGSIGAAAIDTSEIGAFLADRLLAGHRHALEQRYGITAADNTAEAVFDRIAHARGARRKGGAADLERAASILLQDFRSARLGRISLEFPPDMHPPTNHHKQ